MPPKAKITKEMIVNAAFEIAQEKGAENINARTVALKLKCSTQPIMYHFATIDDLKQECYHKLDWYHTEYLMNLQETENDLMLGIGLNYIRFAINEPNLFKFLFQSGYAVENSVLEMIDSVELAPVLNAIQEQTNLTIEKTKQLFLIISLFAHGYASIIANNSLQYNEKLVSEHLEQAYNGAILAVTTEK